MNFVLLALMMIMSAYSHADETLTADDLRLQVALQVQTFVTDPSGKQIEYISPDRSKYAQLKPQDISSVYMDNPRGFAPVRLDFTFAVKADKSMSLTVTQYASVVFDIATGKTVKNGKGRSETFVLSDFGGVSWVDESTPAGRVVTRFIPVFSDESSTMKLTYSPLSLQDVIVSDNAGRVWAEGMSASGEVIRLQTYQGTLYLSFTEFGGSHEIGKLKDRLVDLNLSEKLNVKIRSAKPVLGEGISAKVFGAYIPFDKSPSRTIYSVSAMPSSEAAKRLSTK